MAGGIKVVIWVGGVGMRVEGGTKVGRWLCSRATCWYSGVEKPCRGKWDF